MEMGGDNKGFKDFKDNFGSDLKRSDYMQYLEGSNYTDQY